MTNLKPVDFHGDTLYLTEHEGEPFTPAKAIVDSLGMDWKSQYRKLKNNNLRWGMVEMTIPSKGGYQNQICIPLRKVFAFLSTIHPNKVKPELREKIRRYQAECDDALWQYWMMDRSIRSQKISSSQCRTLQEAVSAAANRCPIEHRRLAYSSLWGGIKTKFRVPTYKDLAASQFDDALDFIRSQRPSLPLLPVPDTPKRMTGATSRRAMEKLTIFIKNELGTDRFDQIKPLTDFIRQCLIGVWAECDEAASKLAVAHGMLRRWTHGYETNALHEALQPR